MEGGGDASASTECQSMLQQGCTNISLTDSDEEAIVNVVKDHALQKKRSLDEKFKDKAKKNCLWERCEAATRCARLGSNPKGLAMEN